MNKKINYDEFLEIIKFLPTKDIINLCNSSKDFYKFCKISKLFVFVLIFKKGLTGSSEYKVNDVIGTFSSYNSAQKEMNKLFNENLIKTEKGLIYYSWYNKERQITKLKDKIRYYPGGNREVYTWEIYATKNFN